MKKKRKPKSDRAIINFKNDIKLDMGEKDTELLHKLTIRYLINITVMMIFLAPLGSINFLVEMRFLSLEHNNLYSACVVLLCLETLTSFALLLYFVFEGYFIHRFTFAMQRRRQFVNIVWAILICGSLFTALHVLLATMLLQ